MRRIVLDMKGGLLSEAVMQSLSGCDPDFLIYRSSKPEETLALCRTCRANVLVMEVIRQGIWKLSERLKICSAVKQLGWTCKVLLLVDEDADELLASEVRQAVKDQLVDNFIYASVSPTYLAGVIDTLAELCAVPGEFVYDSSTEPTIFSGELGTSILDTFKNIGKRFTFGGEPPKDQRVYYFNTKELIGNKYGTPSPVPFRVVDQRAGIDIDIAIRCFGEYSYRISDPILFYTNVCGNVSEDYTRDRLDGQLKTELLTALQPAFAKISDMGIRYSALPGHTMELAEALNEVLSGKWRYLRGLEIVSFGVSSVKASEEDEQMIKELQRNAAFMDPTRAALSFKMGIRKAPVRRQMLSLC